MEDEADVAPYRGTRHAQKTGTGEWLATECAGKYRWVGHVGGRTTLKGRGNMARTLIVRAKEAKNWAREKYRI